jgi:hypothetical protein
MSLTGITTPWFYRLLLLLLLLLLVVVVVVVVVEVVVVFFIAFMHGIFNYIPETNSFSGAYNVAAIL